ncbi:MAG: hypothetical protein RMI30_07315 [Thermodesulfovibrio sp.]|nr:hypothetical protein [Thermodesulfovibrio sp.]MDW7999231.1 hypothetical protein [Thermodesulfovibrio sp.]
MSKAIVYENNREFQKIISDYLKSIGIDCLNPSNNEEASVMFSLEDLSIVVLGEENIEIINQISSLPMYRRREILVFLLSKSLSTMDRLSAFVYGVDCIINIKDLSNFPSIFKRTYSEYQKIYRVFKELLSK